jgi:hypothetical protein
MAAIAALSIQDGAATPVAHTFSPNPDLVSNLPVWVDRSGGIAMGYPKISLSVRNPTKTSRIYKVTLKIATPVMETTSASTASGIPPAPVVSYTPLCNVEFVLPERSTLQQRKDLFAFVKNTLTNAVMASAVQDFEPVW